MSKQISNENFWFKNISSSVHSNSIIRIPFPQILRIKNSRNPRMSEKHSRRSNGVATSIQKPSDFSFSFRWTSKVDGRFFCVFGIYVFSIVYVTFLIRVEECNIQTICYNPEPFVLPAKWEKNIFEKSREKLTVFIAIWVCGELEVSKLIHTGCLYIYD